MAEAEPLCCCEFRNTKGDKSHILACCCDCEALDESVDRCFKCESVPNETIQRFLNDISDRCRIPGLMGKGAIQVNIEIAGPVCLVPISLLIATYGPVTTFFILFLIMPLLMYQLYRCWKKQRHKARTKFFYAWGLTSFILMYLTYELLVFDHGKGDYSENIMLTLGVIIFIYFLILAKSDPGVLTPSDKLLQEIKKMENGNPYLKYNGIVKPVDMDIHQGGNLQRSLTNFSITVAEDASSHCDECHILKPDRAGHCNACNVCVAERDHHCVWIDNCVGRNNHRSFFLALTSFILCGFYGIYLTMQSLCEGTNTLFCSYKILYRDLGNSFGFVGCCYTFSVICLMLALLVNQFFLISQNITSQELYKASAKNQTCFVLYATRNSHNKGFFKNWYSFITKTRSKHMYYDL